MFSYYGTKTKFIHKYPEPMYDYIIEPFAGAARYSLIYYNKNIILNDLYKVVADIWDYLIHCTKEQIENLPHLEWNTNTADLNILQVEKDLLGFLCNAGVDSPRRYVSPWVKENNGMKVALKRILKYIPLIKHWKIFNKDYKDLGNPEVTWFIDPPYQKRTGYKHGSKDIDFDHLAAWCKSRKGQVIICENEGADWLDFKPLISFNGQHTTRMESMCHMVNGVCV